MPGALSSRRPFEAGRGKREPVVFYMRGGRKSHISQASFEREHEPVMIITSSITIVIIPSQDLKNVD